MTEEVLKLTKLDVSYIGIMSIVYIYSIMIGDIAISSIAGIMLGAWFIYKPPEFSVEGVKGIGAAIKMSEYNAGVLSSLVSNIPEAVLVALSFYVGTVTNNIELIEISLIMILATIGVNLILLGVVIILAAKQGPIEVPVEAIQYDTELYRFITVALLSIIFYFLVHAVYTKPEGTLYLPSYFSVFLFASYPLYILLVPRKGSAVVESHLSGKQGAIYFTLGNIGIFIGGHLIVSSVESILAHNKEAIASIGDPIIVIALILALLGALPEHFVAVKSAMRGDVGIGLGNLLGGIAQILLIILAGVGLFIPIPLDKYSLFQLTLVALQFWFIKRSILDDNKLDKFEGIMIILFQLLAFSLLLTT